MKEKLKIELTEKELDKVLLTKLREKEIVTLEDVWSLSKKDLKKLGFNDHEIHKIIIFLELYGLDLGKKVWKK